MQEENDGWLAFAGAAVGSCNELIATATLQLQNSDVDSSSSDDDLQKGKRKHQKKIIWDYTRAHECILEDYLGAVPKLDFGEFTTMIRISRTRFQSNMEDFAEYPFCQKKVDDIGKTEVCFEAELLLPLKTLADGVPSPYFRDYLQMSFPLPTSEITYKCLEPYKTKCCREFHKTSISHYQRGYKRIPDEADLKSITNQLFHVHKNPGMLGPLYCMQNLLEELTNRLEEPFQRKSKDSVHRVGGNM
jgi:hypothetical protein